ncbi:hypothetical protein ASPTUDRAFT_194058 [Aspergillus tubingensis CBS 134.48]|uniref:Uncharacterized protein n=1 Tax=Aspergillus tubingensis (strain CBS 134.48) TaxID=767770 RepID=A0A1L9MUL4_ASPTC|nr:hypothetical protein ASPTUDRAFT_194058 [Aspergillus tubingensis CBS 134.48]
MGQGIDTELSYINTHTRQASVGLMGRAWDNNTPHTTQTHNGSGLMVGWMGWAWNTAHQDIWPQGATTYPAQGATTLLAHGRVEGTGLGQQSTTRQHNTGSGLMVGWMGRAWKTLLYTLTPIYDTRDNFSGPMARQHFWPHGWVDGTGLEDHIIYTYSVLTQGHTASATSQALVGWQGRAWAIRRSLAVDIGHKAVSYQMPHLGMTGFTSTTNQALVGWQGWAWVVARRHRLTLSEPRRDWLVGTGWVTSVTRHWASSVSSPGWLLGMGWAAVVDIGDPALSPPANQALVWVHTVNQASVGWSGRAWDIGFNIHHTGSLQRIRPWLGGRDGPGTSDLNITRRFAAVSQASVGRLGRAWDIGFNIHHIGSLQRTRPRLGGWDGPGTSDTGGGGFGSRFTAVVSQASVGWLGRAWDIGHGGGGWSHPWMGGRDGLGLLDSTSIIQVHCSGEPQALVGWLGRAWDNNSPHTTHVHCSGEPGPGWVEGSGLGSTNFNSKRFTAVVNQALLPDKTPCPGWVDGKGLGYRLTTTAQFTTAVNQASAGWTGRAWDTLTNFNSIGSPLQWTRPRLGGWDGPGT